MYNELSLSPHKEIRDLIIRLRFLKRTYGITESEIYDIRWYLSALRNGFTYSRNEYKRLARLRRGEISL